MQKSPAHPGAQMHCPDRGWQLRRRREDRKKSVFLKSTVLLGFRKGEFFIPKPKRENAETAGGQMRNYSAHTEHHLQKTGFLEVVEPDQRYKDSPCVYLLGFVED